MTALSFIHRDLLVWPLQCMRRFLCLLVRPWVNCGKFTGIRVQGKDGATKIRRYEFAVDGRIGLGPADFCIT